MRGKRVVDAKLSRSALCVPSERISRMNRILTRSYELRRRRERNEERRVRKEGKY